MGILDRIRENRIKRAEYIEKSLADAKEIQTQKVKSRENIAKEVVKKIGNRDINIGGCPFIGRYSDGKMIELTKDPDDKDEPFGWPKGTVRGILTLLVVEGFFIMTFLLFYKFDLPINIIFQMWQILAGVFSIVVASYFWTRIKMGNNGGNMFNPFGF